MQESLSSMRMAGAHSWNTRAQSRAPHTLSLTFHTTKKKKKQGEEGWGKAGFLPWNATWLAWGFGRGGEVHTQLPACCVTSGLQAATGGPGLLQGQYFPQGLTVSLPEHVLSHSKSLSGLSIS